MGLKSIDDLRRGLKSGWVVTRNDEGTIFVHEREIGGTLEGLQSLIRESSNTWSVYAPKADGSGGNVFGQPIGMMEKRREIEIHRVHLSLVLKPSPSRDSSRLRERLGEARL